MVCNSMMLHTRFSDWRFVDVRSITANMKALLDLMRIDRIEECPGAPLLFT